MLKGDKIQLQEALYPLISLCEKGIILVVEVSLNKTKYILI